MATVITTARKTNVTLRLSISASRQSSETESMSLTSYTLPEKSPNPRVTIMNYAFNVCRTLPNGMQKQAAQLNIKHTTTMGTGFAVYRRLIALPRSTPHRYHFTTGTVMLRLFHQRNAIYLRRLLESSTLSKRLGSRPTSPPNTCGGIPDGTTTDPSTDPRGTSPAGAKPNKMRHRCPSREHIPLHLHLHRKAASNLTCPL